MRKNLIADHPRQVQERLFAPYNLILNPSEEQSDDLTINSPAGQSGMGINYLWIRGIFPFTGGIMLMLAIVTTGGYLLQQLMEEKKNRMLEILMTSVSPQSLLLGKVLANMSVGLTQLLVWLSYPLAAALMVLASNSSINIDDLLGLPFWLSVILMLLAFVTVSALMGMIASIMDDEKYTQLISSLIMLAVMAPMYVWGVVVNYPNWWLTIAMSLFPLTSTITMPLRVALTDVKSWQIVLSVGFAVVSAAGSLTLVGYVFRWWMLHYGKPLKFDRFLRRG